MDAEARQRLTLASQAQGMKFVNVRVDDLAQMVKEVATLELPQLYHPVTVDITSTAFTHFMHMKHEAAQEIAVALQLEHPDDADNTVASPQDWRVMWWFRAHATNQTEQLVEAVMQYINTPRDVEHVPAF